MIHREVFWVWNDSQQCQLTRKLIIDSCAENICHMRGGHMLICKAKNTCPSAQSLMIHPGRQFSRKHCQIYDGMMRTMTIVLVMRMITMTIWCW